MECKYDLSICIPTHNRAILLKETLTSIINQINDYKVQVVIYDSASTDDTKEVVYYFKKQFKDIKYIHSEKKKGIDLDMAETVKYAEGEYCWLVSDDDPINNHALKTLFKDLKLNHEIYLCDRVVCDKKLNPIRNRNWLRSTQSNTYKLSNPIQLENYLDNCLEFGAIFSYMCAIIFKRLL